MSKLIADLIPAEERQIILRDNLISKAVAVAGNYEMERLMIIWKEYIEYDLKITCQLCYSRVLKNFNALLPFFIESEKQTRLLNES